MTDDQNSKTMNTVRPPLPDLVIRKILQRLHTKSAVRISFLSKEWEGIWSSSPVIDFDEGEPQDDHNNLDKLQHRKKFISIMERYFKLRLNDKKLFDKLRIRMIRDLMEEDDARMVDKWLSFAIEKSVKELDLSLKYQVSLQTLLNAKALTSLNLEYVRMIKNSDEDEPERFPSLKTVSLKAVDFINLSLPTLISRCPCIGSLSLTSCSFNSTCLCLGLERTFFDARFLTTLHLEGLKILDENCNTKFSISLPSLKTMSLENVQLGFWNVTDLIKSGCPSLECLSFSHCSATSLSMPVLYVSSSSLKSLEVTNCNFRDVVAYEVENLQYFTLVSESPKLERTQLVHCANLKYLNIHAQNLKDFRLHGCKDCVKATVNTPNLVTFTFTGYLKSQFSLEAPNLSWTVIDLWDREPTFDGAWEHFSAMRDYLEKFDGCREIYLYVHDAKAFIFSENFRKFCSPPLPSLKNLEVFIKIPQEARDSDLWDSLRWLAPSAIISTNYINNPPWYHDCETKNH